ncbi:metabotropic glutamate receptor 3-like [Tubulanus polymorphus]|uniref:metabotropic glutamate receptor 3-like n=1 Tax=Tubulanus polymorphus TaxID=672921 RepID=UPI003DA33146
MAMVYFREIWKVLVLLLLMILLVDYSKEIIIPDVTDEPFTIAGDLILGVVKSIGQNDKRTSACNGKVSIGGVITVEMFSFAIAQVNANKSLLPGIKLGMRFFDTCGSERMAVARPMQLLDAMCPQNNARTYGQLVGAIGDGRSKYVVHEARILRQFSLPVMSTAATSDELSDQKAFPYFLRTAPPDEFQTTVMVDILTQFNWSYFSMLYVDDSYGIFALNNLYHRSKQKGICMAYSKSIGDLTTDDEYEDIIKTLWKQKRARVIISFLSGKHLFRLLHKLKKFLEVKKAESNHFIWIGSDAFRSPSSWEDKEMGVGSIYIDLDFKTIHEKSFYHYFGLLTYENITNPWKDILVEYLFNCTWNSSPNWRYLHCEKFQNVSFNESERFKDIANDASSKFATTHDCIFAFAFAIQEMISQRCPNVSSGDTNTLEVCIHGHLLYDYLLNVSFTGLAGPIAFDSVGNGMTGYKISQFQYNPADGFRHVVIGNWDRARESIHIEMNKMNWNAITNTAPRSYCSEPCPPGHYSITLDVHCCWKCQPCRSNEITNFNKTDCVQCKEFSWPDQNTFLDCVEIAAVALNVSHPVGITLIVLVTAGLVIDILIVSVYIRYRHERLIKAASRELSFVTLFGTSISFLLVLVLLAKPSSITCSIHRIGFNVSYSIIYCPLLVKTNRIYRIFSAGKRGLSQIRYISGNFQMFATTALITIQVMHVINRMSSSLPLQI